MTTFTRLNGRWFTRLSVLTTAVSGARALAAGRTKRGALLLGATLLSLQWSGVGVLTQLAAYSLDRR